MAYDTVSMSVLFPACIDVLKKILVPIHYADLTELGLNELDIKKSQVNWHRQIEDVREKLAEKERFDLFYTGADLGCLVGIKWWFTLNQLRLFHPTSGYVIPGDATSSALGAFEALMRDPYYLTKTKAPRDRRMMGRANGLVVEQIVADWFRHEWPEFFVEKRNKDSWDKPCSHDFMLNVYGQLYQIDVSGPKLNGSYGNPGKGKKRVDYHLLCELSGKNVLWRDVRTGADYHSDIFPEGGIWPERMITWLNCAKYNLDYTKIKNFVTGFGNMSSKAT